MKKSDNRKVVQTLVLISQIGLSMLVPILLCVWFGQFLNNRCSIDLTVLLLLLGILAGCRNSWKLLMDAVRDDSDKKS